MHNVQGTTINVEWTIYKRQWVRRNVEWAMGACGVREEGQSWRWRAWLPWLLCPCQRMIQKPSSIGRMGGAGFFTLALARSFSTRVIKSLAYCS